MEVFQKEGELKANLTLWNIWIPTLFLFCGGYHRKMGMKHGELTRNNDDDDDDDDDKHIYIYKPVVPHKAVAEVSKIGNL